MSRDARPPTARPRCPRCDEELQLALAGRRRGRGWTLVCPEPHCDYRWTPTRLELDRMARPALGGPSEDGGDALTRQASRSSKSA